MAEISDDVRAQIEQADFHEAEKAEVLKVVNTVLDDYSQHPDRRGTYEDEVVLVRIDLEGEGQLGIVPIRAAILGLRAEGVSEELLAYLRERLTAPRLRFVFFSEDRSCCLQVPLPTDRSTTITTHHVGHA